MKITPEILAELREAAMKATPGPWRNHPYKLRCRNGKEYQMNRIISDERDRGITSDDWDWKCVAIESEDMPLSDDDAHFIARADPATVLALLDELDQQIARTDKTERRLQKADEVVMLARKLGAYSWEDRLDDSRVSDDAKHDARELSIAVYLYDRDSGA